MISDTLGPPDTTTIDIPADSLTFDRASLLFLIPRLAIAPGTAATITVFDARTLRAYPVHLAMREARTITRSNGPVEAYGIDVTGDLWLLPQVWFVSVQAPRRILSIEWARGVVFESTR